MAEQHITLPNQDPNEAWTDYLEALISGLLSLLPNAHNESYRLIMQRTDGEYLLDTDDPINDIPKHNPKGVIYFFQAHSYGQFFMVIMSCTNEKIYRGVFTVKPNRQVEHKVPSEDEATDLEASLQQFGAYKTKMESIQDALKSMSTAPRGNDAGSQ
jgi:predicted GIY-YIG superfamily endonuclease